MIYYLTREKGKKKEKQKRSSAKQPRSRSAPGKQRRRHLGWKCIDQRNLVAQELEFN